MHFTHMGWRVTLQDVQDNATVCKPMQFSKLQGLTKRGEIYHIVQVCLAPNGKIIPGGSFGF
jgi:hypothetical protein